MLSKTATAALIDHTALKPDTTEQQIAVLCSEAREHHFASVCVNPCRVALASSLLQGSGVAVCTVVGFPLGASTTEVKVFECRNAIENGAVEIDMVINIGKVKEHDYQAVQDEVCAVVSAAKSYQNILVKVIIETCLLTDEEKQQVCRILLSTEADFVKTSTGFSTGGATTHDVSLLKTAVMGAMKVKASGGIKTMEDLSAMVAAGADRIGTSSGTSIVKVLPVK